MTARRMLIVDTLVAILVNAVVFPVGLHLAGLSPPASLLGSQGAVLDATLATICPIVLMTILMTLVLRARFNRQLPAGSDATLRRRSLTPPHVLLRAIILAIIGLLFLMPVRVALIWALGLLPMDGRSHFLLNLLYGVVIGLVFMPIIFIETLSDFGGARVAPRG